VLAANLEMTCLGSPATLGSRRPDEPDTLGSDILDRRRPTSDRCWAQAWLAAPPSPGDEAAANAIISHAGSMERLAVAKRMQGAEGRPVG
jgi:hypothetical protein